MHIIFMFGFTPNEQDEENLQAHDADRATPSLSSLSSYSYSADCSVTFIA